LILAGDAAGFIMVAVNSRWNVLEFRLRTSTMLFFDWSRNLLSLAFVDKQDTAGATQINHKTFFALCFS
jgi:hypothetical protein